MAELQDVMDEAVERCIEHVDTGGLPFIGVLVDETGVISEFGVNRVSETLDLSAHAEIVAMRDAMATQDSDNLTGAALLATGEPCGLCYRFALDHGVDAIYAAIDRDAAAEWGFDYRSSYPSLGITEQMRSGVFHSLTSERGAEPFIRYRETNIRHERWTRRLILPFERTQIS